MGDVASFHPLQGKNLMLTHLWWRNQRGKNSSGCSAVIRVLSAWYCSTLQYSEKKKIKPQNPIGHPSKPRRPSPNYFKYLCSIFKAYCKAYLGQSLWNGHNLKLGFLYPWEGQKRQRMIILLLQKQVGWEWLYLILEVFCGALAFGKTEQKSNW